MRECLERGEWFTKPPIGYVVDRACKEKHRLKIDEKGQLITLAFKWRANGTSNTEILLRLRDRGLLLYKQRLTEIFHNPFYCGKIRHYLLGDKLVQGVHPPIIDEETFNEVNGIETHIGYSHTGETPETPLKLFVRCDQCGRFLTGYEVKKKHLHYYKCSGKGCQSNVSAKDLHQQFYLLLSEYNVPEQYTDVLATFLEQEINHYGQSAKIELAKLEEQKESLSTQLREATTRFGTGVIPEDVFGITRQTLTQKIDEIDIEIKSQKIAHSNQQIDIKRAIVTAGKLADYWKNSSYKNKQNIQNFAYPGGLNFSRKRGLTLTCPENEALRIFHLFSTHYTSLRETKKEENREIFLGSSGRRTRTSDLRVMSPTSYRLLYPAVLDCKGKNNYLKFQIAAKIARRCWPAPECPGRRPYDARRTAGRYNARPSPPGQSTNGPGKRKPPPFPP